MVSDLFISSTPYLCFVKHSWERGGNGKDTSPLKKISSYLHTNSAPFFVKFFFGRGLGAITGEEHGKETGR
jgi:hypothetical protein